jgi:tRNA (guanosine-2'-O-)-methyltransferase
VKPLGRTDLKRLHRYWRRRTEGRVALLLDSVQNPYNLGTIARHAAAYRVEQAWLVGDPQAFGHPKARKTAMGTDRLVPWQFVATPAEGLAAAAGAGFRLVGVELVADAQPLFAVDFSVPTCLVLGHEERGLSPVSLGRCDETAFIPQLGKVGSLNVAAAAAIALYEARRHEWVGGEAPEG